MNIAAIVALCIFILMFVLLITEKLPRHISSLLCAVLTIGLVFGLCMRDTGAIWETLSLRSFLTPSFWFNKGTVEPSVGINWETILFIFGMMIMVEGMAASGFFRWLCISIARAVHFKPVPIFFIFTILAAVLSMFIDSITVIMFLAAVTVEIAKLLHIDPRPLLLSEIFCANLGGSATMCGDPPNIIIGTSLGYTFFDFLSNTGLIALLALIFSVFYFYLCFRKKLKAENMPTGEIALPNAKDAITSKSSFISSCLIFLCAIILLITHAQTGLTVSTIGMIVAILTLLCNAKNAGKLVKSIDYHTLLFFTGLFVVVSGLEKTGILTILANAIQKVSGGNVIVMIVIILFGSGIASAIIDNIPFAATMIPVIRTLSSMQGVDLQTLAWTLSMGTDIGGSATPIGASANVVGTSISAKNGYPISWKEYCKYQVPVTLLVLAISTAVIIIRYI